MSGMPKKEKRSTKPAPASSRARSKTKPIAILLIGLVGAVALAGFLSQGAEESATPAPAASAFSLSISPSAYSRGPEDARVTLVEFGDYQCPTCAVFHPIVSELLRRFPSDLRFEYHHIPLVSIHANAIFAATAAEAAGEAGRFWEMHELLFVNQSNWAPHPNPEPLFVSYAEQAGIDPERFRTLLRSPTVEARVQADIQEAVRLGVNSTPTFFVNGRPIPLPRNAQEFENVVYAAIQESE
jgi:protein-disulfide isomerase